MSKKIDAALANLCAEATRLAPEQGRIARRNARRAVLGALRQVRNAMNSEFPKMQRPKMGATEFVIEILERGPKRVGRRLYIDRWVTFRKDRFPFSVGSTAFAQKLFDPSTGYCRPMDFATAAKYAKRLQADFDEYLWRLREVGARHNVIMAAIL